MHSYSAQPKQRPCVGVDEIAKRSEINVSTACACSRIPPRKVRAEHEVFRSDLFGQQSERTLVVDVDVEPKAFEVPLERAVLA